MWAHLALALGSPSHDEKRIPHILKTEQWKLVGTELGVFHADLKQIWNAASHV